MKHIVIDFETYYDNQFSVATMGNVNYADAVDAYCVSIKSDDIRHVGDLVDPKTLEMCANITNDPNVCLWAHNAGFDRTFWEKHFGKTAGTWRCSANLSVGNQHPRALAMAIKSAFGRRVDKAVRADMKGVDYYELPAHRKQAVLDYCLHDVDFTWDLIEHFGFGLTAIEEKIAGHTLMTNARGVYIDQDELTRGINMLNQAAWEALNRIPWADGDPGATPLSAPKFKRFCAEAKVPCPASVDKRNLECTRLMAEYPVLNEVITAMRQYRGANTKIQKLQGIEKRIGPDGCMPMDLLYCGAPHTRRWSSIGINMQNLDSSDFEFGEHSFGIRGVFVPRPGKKFLVKDYCQIEPRCLNWLVGNDEFLDIVRQGYSLYEAYARQTGQWSGDDQLKHANPKLYRKIKAQILGLGYGMGVNRYEEEWNKTAAPGEEIDNDEARSQVYDWRGNNKLITRFWRQLDKDILTARQEGDHTLEIEMPSGEPLKHFRVQPVFDPDTQQITGHRSTTVKGSYTKGDVCNSLWGGLLTENVTQRLARDIMAQGIVRLEEAGIPVIFHAHDELIMEVDEDAGEDTMKQVAELMSITPDYCKEIPLEVEGVYVDRYQKV